MKYGDWLAKQKNANCVMVIADNENEPWHNGLNEGVQLKVFHESKFVESWNTLGPLEGNYWISYAVNRPNLPALDGNEVTFEDDPKPNN